MNQFQGDATPLVGIMLVGWLPVVLVMFMLMRPRRAVLVSFLVSWLFLPIASYDLPLIPNYDKMTATCISVIIGTLVFDAQRIFQFRLKWFDLPVIIFCVVSPILSSVSNGLGIYDGLSLSLSTVFMWGIPYFIGRIYFFDPGGQRELALAIFAGGLIYIPLCLYEIRMSPQLHYVAYGYHQHDFGQAMRGDGSWRPMVFMVHGLMVGMWMTASALVGFWLWQAQGMKHVFRVPMPVLVFPLMATSVLVRSTGATVLLAVGIGVLMFSKWFRTRSFLLGLQGAVMVYLFLRVTGIVDGSSLVEIANQTLGSDRAQSLKTRMDSERILATRAWDRPLLGWGRWGRNQVVDEGSDMGQFVDSLWVITFSSQGLVGLISVVLLIMLPTFLFVQRIPPPLWVHPVTSPALVLSLILVLWMIDNTLNAMINPIFLLVAGGLNGFLSTPSALRNSLRAAAPASNSISP